MTSLTETHQVSRAEEAEVDPACRFSTCCDQPWECYECPDHSSKTDDRGLSSAGSSVIDPLRQQAELVRDLRVEAAGIRDEINQRRQQWEEQNKPLLDAASINSTALREAERDLRDMGAAIFETTGVKSVGCGVAIRTKTYLDYNGVEALRWAKERGLFLVLDVKAFESFAKNLPREVPFVKVAEDNQVTIATDLAKALGDSSRPFVTVAV